MVLGLGCALVAAVLYGFAAVLQATGARQVARTPGLDPRVMFRVLRHPPAVLALVLLMVGFVLHLVAVRLLPLFLAQTGIAVSLVITAVLAVVAFGERLSAVEWTAVGGVFAGLLLLSASAGDVGDNGTTRMAEALLLGVVLIVLLAWPASRRHSTLSTAALGALSGFGYAIVGIAGRLLPGWTPGQLLGSLSTYALVLAGVTAFFLYTLALQRGLVTVATTPLIVTQTVTPAVVGLVFLGDAIRPGWTAGAVAGFLVTLAGALALVRFERRDAPQERRENGRAPIG